MHLFVDIGINRVRLSLVNASKTVDSLDWEENNSMSRFLLANIDKILRRNKIGLDKISDYKIMNEVPEKYTSFRIVKITLESLAMANS